MKRRHHTPAFTIVELIVAISVVLLLIAILTQSIGKVTERASVAKSSSNIRQSTTSLLMLAGNSGGKIMVRSGGTGSGTLESSFWAVQLERALGISRDVFFSDLAEHGLGDSIYETESFWGWRVSYGINLTLDEWESTVREEGEWPVNSLTLASVENPSETILLASSMNPSGFGRHAINHRGPGTGGALHLRYNNKALVGFLDGSVRALSGEELRRYGFLGGYGDSVSEWITFESE
jgi:hypothetical protein